MSWAVGSWHILEAKAALHGATRPGGPVSLLDLDARWLLAFAEGVLRESPDHNEALDDLYAAAVRTSAKPEIREDRNREIDRAMRLFGA